MKHFGEPVKEYAALEKIKHIDLGLVMVSLAVGVLVAMLVGVLIAFSEYLLTKQSVRDKALTQCKASHGQWVEGSDGFRCYFPVEGR